MHICGEIHERVPTHQEVDAGDGRVLDQVVPAEDHASTQVLAEHVPLVGTFEELLECLLGNVLELSRGVGGVARLLERFLVDIRRVDLHPVDELLIAENAGEDHGEAVRLLAAGAAG